MVYKKIIYLLINEKKNNEKVFLKNFISINLEENLINIIRLFLDIFVLWFK